MISKALKTTLLSTAIAAFIVGCGGSNDNSTRQGVAIDFALKNATVNFIDCNYTTTTNDLGKFDLPDPKNCIASEITITDGVDTATGLDFNGVLKFKKTEFYTLSDVVVSPLTSLEFYLEKAGKSDQLSTVLSQLGLPAISDVKQFNPETSNAHNMSVVFVLQQLITQIEEKLGGSETHNAQAVNAVIDALLAPNADKLFDAGSLTVNPTTLSNILTNTSLSSTEKALINQKTAQLANFVESVSTNTTAENLKAELSKEQKAIDTIIDSTITAKYTDSGFQFAGYDLAIINASSSTNLKALSLNNLASNLAVQFKLNTSTAAEDTLKVGFKLLGSRNSATETLDIIINSLVVKYDATGAIIDATIPAGTSIAVKTSIANQPTNTVVTNTNALQLAQNGSISLAKLIDSSSRLETEYNKYVNLIQVNDQLEASTYILSSAFPIDISSLTEDSLEISTLKVSGKKVTGFFKIN